MKNYLAYFVIKSITIQYQSTECNAFITVRVY